MLTESPTETPRQLGRVGAVLLKLDRHAEWLLPVYIGVYLAATIPAARRPLWFDELFTYYLALSRNAGEFFGRVFHVDLNPPLSYFFAAASMRLFGDSPFAVRLPFLLAFLGASLAVFALARKRLGGLAGLTAMVLMWSCGFLDFATDARPYALLLAFFAFAFLFWSKLEPRQGFTWNHGLLSGSLGLMVLTHCFSVFMVPAFFLGELVRAVRAKRIDIPAWLSLMVPMLLLATYIPLLGRAESAMFPQAFLPSLPRAGLFYAFLMFSPGFLVWIPLVVVYLIPPPPGSRLRLAAGEIAFLSATLLMPLMIMGYLARAHVAYWPRYGIGAVIAFSVGSTFVLAWKTNQRVFASAIAAALTLIGFCVQTYPALSSYFRPAPVLSTDYLRIHPELPFVTASGLAFLEMDHREGPEFVHRLYYLTDKASAIKYAHATMFEGLPNTAKYFPVRAKVVPYTQFIEAHNHFLVFATPHFPEDWLLDKLKDDGARIQQVAVMHTSYRDTTLYEVQLKREVHDPHSLN